jgi:hypothetical protein
VKYFVLAHCPIGPNSVPYFVSTSTKSGELLRVYQLGIKILKSVQSIWVPEPPFTFKMSILAMQCLSAGNPAQKSPRWIEDVDDDTGCFPDATVSKQHQTKSVTLVLLVNFYHQFPQMQYLSAFNSCRQITRRSTKTLATMRAAFGVPRSDRSDKWRGPCACLCLAGCGSSRVPSSLGVTPSEWMHPEHLRSCEWREIVR